MMFLTLHQIVRNNNVSKAWNFQRPLKGYHVLKRSRQSLLSNKQNWITIGYGVWWLHWFYENKDIDIDHYWRSCCGLLLLALKSFWLWGITVSLIIIPDLLIFILCCKVLLSLTYIFFFFYLQVSIQSLTNKLVCFTLGVDVFLNRFWTTYLIDRYFKF